MENSKEYYTLLDSIVEPDGTKCTNKNAMGLIACGIPFKNHDDAIRYMMRCYPDNSLNAPPIVHNPAEAKRLALADWPEANMFRHTIAEMLDMDRASLHALSERIKKMEVTSLKDEIDKQLLCEELEQLQGRCAALHDAWQKIHDRCWELYELGAMRV